MRERERERERGTKSPSCLKKNKNSEWLHKERRKSEVVTLCWRCHRCCCCCCWCCCCCRSCCCHCWWCWCCCCWCCCCRWPPFRWQLGDCLKKEGNQKLLSREVLTFFIPDDHVALKNGLVTTETKFWPLLFLNCLSFLVESGLIYLFLGLSGHEWLLITVSHLLTLLYWTILLSISFLALGHRTQQKWQCCQTSAQTIYLCPKMVLKHSHKFWEHGKNTLRDQLCLSRTWQSEHAENTENIGSDVFRYCKNA